MKCEYGCNKIAKYQLKNGKWCCSEFATQCSFIKDKNSKGVAKAHKNGLLKSGFTEEDRLKSNLKAIQQGIKNNLVKESLASNAFIKKILIQHLEWEEKCSECGLTEWNGKKLSLDLDHINGVNNDNRVENLRFLCPNCHRQTETYCGKNINNGKKRVDDAFIIKAIKHSKNIRRVLMKVGLTPKGANYERVKKIMTEHKLEFVRG